MITAGIPKPALSLEGHPHQFVDYIQEGVAAGWRLVFFKNGNELRMTTTELARKWGVDPFANVYPLIWDGE
jgi:hypothetical protein